MKKRILSLLAVLGVLTAVFAGCSGTADSGQPANASNGDSASVSEKKDSTAGSAGIGDWSIAIEGVDGVAEFTSEDAAALTSVSIEMTITNKKGEASVNTYTGVTLSSILDAVGAGEFSAVTVEASDGFSAEYSSELALADDTILAWASDGEAFEGEPPLRMCPAQGTGNQFVRNAAKIIVTG